MADVHAHRNDRVFFHDYALDHFGAGADKAVIFDDGGTGLHGLEHAADTHATAEVHVFPDLGARAYGSPGIDHGAFIDIGADVDVRGHQNRAFADVAATARYRGRHHAHASGLHARFVHVRKLGLHLVVKAQLTGLDHAVVFQAETEQHGLFDPLVRSPLAHALARRHTQAAVIELAYHMLHRIAHFLRRRGGRNIGTVFPCGVHNGLELLCHK